ncbi:MAG: methyl-accepting chemotaxis [Geobacteraceae bacterium]|nr:MAG: methyl-accepting chemotaxis [Geobacteraceae bacterium]
MSWKNLKVRTRMMTLISGLCISMLLVGVVGLLNMRELSVGIGEANDGLHHVAVLSKIEKDFVLLRLNLVYMLSLTDAAKIEQKVDNVGKQTQTIKESLAGIEKTDLDDKERELLKEFKEGFESYLVQGLKLAEKAKKALGGSSAEHAEVVNFATASVAPLYEKPANALEKLVELNEKQAKDMYQTDMAAYHRAFGIMLGLILAAAIISIVCGTLVSNSVTKPLARVVDMLRDIAQGEGDLTKRLDASAKDEIGELCTWFNTFIDKLHGIISQVAQNTVQVASAASQLFSTSEQMATGTEEVAAQTGTVAAASEEMAATSSEIAQNCGMAADGSRLANDAALKGSTVVEETVAVMNRIAERVKESAHTVGSLGERSDQIGAIIGTIEDIADQTNLLALNAAIEAARAGEQGRGFAVVADEVRALAERTTKATREIGEMIKAIQNETKGAVGAMEEGVKEVERGTSEAAKSGQALRDILDQINSVTMQVSQIATAAEQQTATTNEITNNIQQITEVVQETSNGAHESANAASQLASLAEDLQKLVRQFKLAA